MRDDRIFAAVFIYLRVFSFFRAFMFLKNHFRSFDFLTDWDLKEVRSLKNEFFKELKDNAVKTT